MFERYVADALALHFNHILSNFDADQVKVSVWNGEVILKDLMLRPDAIQQILNQHGIVSVENDLYDTRAPFQIIYGKIGTFELHIPWKILRLSTKRLRKGTTESNKDHKTCSIILSDVDILIAPGQPDANSEQPNDEDATKARIQKEQKVQNIMNEIFNQNSETNVEKPKDGAKFSFVKQFAKNVFSSLSITLNNIHLRYEDSGNHVGFENLRQSDSIRFGRAENQSVQYRPPFAVGIALEEFYLGNIGHGPKDDSELYSIPRFHVAGTIDTAEHEQSEATSQGDDDAECITLQHTVQHKIAAATNLSMYWDSDLSTNDLILQKLNTRNSKGDNRIQERTSEELDTFYDAAGSNDHSMDYDIKYLSERTVSYELEARSLEYDNSFAEKFREALVLQSSKRNYVLHPISCSLHCSIFNRLETDTFENDQKIMSAKTLQDSTPIPSSRGLLSIESAQLNITKTTLEDIAYLRRSITLWNDSKANAITRQLFFALTDARPVVSPMQNPRAWWIYAYAAILSVHKVQLKARKMKESRSRKGWIGLFEALMLRRRYVHLSIEFLRSSGTEQKEMINHELNKLEDDLSAEEIVAFRIYVLDRIKQEIQSPQVDDDRPLSSRNISIAADLSSSYRKAAYMEMIARASDVNNEIYELFEVSHQTYESVAHLKENVKLLSRFKIVLFCQEVIFQVYDKVKTATNLYLRSNIAQFRCAIVQELILYNPGEWDITFTFASLELLDQTESSDSAKKLITKKGESKCTKPIENEWKVVIQNQSYSHSATVVLKRTLIKNSTVVVTALNVHVSPMEVLYAPESISSLSTVFKIQHATVFSHDYHRLKAMISSLTSKQKNFLYRTLSQSDYVLSANIDIAAPVLIMRDQTSDGILIVDLGRMIFHDIPISQKPKDGFDNVWNLRLHDVQVVCMSGSAKESSYSIGTTIFATSKTNHLVEPFSLEFSVHTKLGMQIASTLHQTESFSSNIFVHAVMPRLVFNLHSSSVRLLNRIIEYRKIRKIHYVVPPSSSDLNDITSSRYLPGFASKGGSKFYQIDFNFSAPYIELSLINDTDCLSNGTCSEESFLVAEVIIKGIGGSWSQYSVDDEVDASSFSARLRCLYARDLFQKAGKEFSLLVSSIKPDDDSNGTAQNVYPAISSFENGDSSSDIIENSYDLFTVTYEKTSNLTDGRRRITSKLAIVANELYIEWNPETFACIQRSLRLSQEERSLFHSIDREFIHARQSEEPKLDENEFFCDAFEDPDDSIYFSSDSPVSSRNRDLFLFISSPMVRNAVKDITSKSSAVQGAATPIPVRYDANLPSLPSLKNFNASFHLSKLRVRFNKESRLRRLVIAEMNETEVTYFSKLPECGKTHAKIGNFTMIDPSRVNGDTLYGEIVGLKSDTSKSDSMLEVTYETFPRSVDLFKELGAPDLELDSEKFLGVAIDSVSRHVRGGDALITMHFSPMRFVYLQQLWFEIADYFFEGILGYEVWGQDRPDINRKKEEKEVKVIDRIKSLFSASTMESSFPWADAFQMKFLRFRVIFESPVIILPVEYKSPQHLKLDLGRTTATNWFGGDIASVHESSFTYKYVQWFNNCVINVEDYHFSSWCGTQLNIDDSPPKVTTTNTKKCCIPISLVAKWPIGPTSFLQMPKWHFQCSIDQVRLSLRKKDYALFQHFIYYNVGEESRHLAEWNELQNLPLDQLEGLKKKTRVHFGYDIKDSPPATLHFGIEITNICLHFFTDENVHLADLSGYCVRWSLRKMSDKVSRQLLSFRNIHLTQASCSKFEYLMFPLETEESVEDRFCNVIYRSISEPSGVVSKHLEINHSCIFLSCRAWVNFIRFFRNLSDPMILTKNEVLSSVQISDRWYRICPDNSEKNVSTAGHSSTQSNKACKYQFHILLKFPRIVLANLAFNDARALILQMDNLEYLYTNLHESKLNKSFVMDKLEVFTGLASDALRKLYINHKESLVFPMCCVGGSENVLENGILMGSKSWISSDLISFKVAYTEMSLAIELYYQIIRDYNSVVQRTPLATASSDHPNDVLDSSYDAIQSLSLGSFTLLIVDDSGRHFANAQELIDVHFDSILLKREKYSKPLKNGMTSTTLLQLYNAEILDCLQNLSSPFKIVAMGNHLQDIEFHGNQSAPNKRTSLINTFIFKDQIIWEKYRSVAGGVLFDISESLTQRGILTLLSVTKELSKISVLIDVRHNVFKYCEHSYILKMKSLVLQWNPSMAIALQRFLGRLLKHAKDTKTLDLESKEAQTLMICPKSLGTNSNVVDAEISMESLTICLNKDHQQRRLLQVTMTFPFVAFHKVEGSRLSIRGRIGDFNAWDSDGTRSGQTPIIYDNRSVACVLINPSEDNHLSSSSLDLESSNFLSFCYHRDYATKPGIVLDNGELEDRYPSFIWSDFRSIVNEMGIDDCLYVSIASVRLNHIKERTCEIVDYLSKGLPGKGMGATSRAAKGFIKKRIKTKSYLKLSMDSAQLLIPRHRGTNEGIILFLGALQVKSWFNEASLEAVSHNEYSCSNKSGVQNDLASKKLGNVENILWRILSLSILGFGWHVRHLEENFTCDVMENPIDMFLDIKKPSDNLKLPLIVRCEISPVDAVLTYTDYVMIHRVAQENIFKFVDKSLWDAHKIDVELFDVKSQQDQGELNDKPELMYSKDARFIRYGDDRSVEVDHDQDDISRSSLIYLDLWCRMENITLILRRDDVSTSQDDYEFDLYDIVCFKLDDMTIDIKTTSLGRFACAKIHSFSLVDIGDAGRLKRNQKMSHDKSRKHSRPTRLSAFHVVAERCNNQSDDNKDSLYLNEPQVVLKWDTNSSNTISVGDSKYECDKADITSISLTLNQTDVNPLIRPLSDIISFINRKWDVDVVEIEFRPTSPVRNETQMSYHSVREVQSSSGECRGSQFIKGFHFSLEANHPRLFLLADECDPETRALVLKGLCTLKATSVQEMDCLGIVRSEVLSIDAQMKSLESYINSHPIEALEMNRSFNYHKMDHEGEMVGKRSFEMRSLSLGIGLIEPLTASCTFRQIQQLNSPTTKDVSIAIESVSTTLSFEDCRLIELVLSRWKSQKEYSKISNISPESAYNSESPSIDGMDGTNIHFESRKSFPRGSIVSVQQDCVNVGPDVLPKTFTTESQSKFCDNIIVPDIFCTKKVDCDTASKLELHSSQTFDLVFDDRKLGLVLRIHGSKILVDEKLDSCPFSEHIKVGDEIVSLSGTSVIGMSLRDFTQRLNVSKRPLSVRFHRESKCSDLKDNNIVTNALESVVEDALKKNNPNVEDLNVSVASTRNKENESHFHNYVHQQSVDKSLPFTILLKRGFPTGFKIRRSQCGDIPVITHFDKETFTSACVGSFNCNLQPGTVILAVGQENALEIGYNSAERLLECYSSSTTTDEETYSIACLVASSDDWGSIEKIDISISTVNVTLINDINGRDMPLLRANLDALTVITERGLGLECKYIEVKPPSIISLRRPDDYSSTPYVIHDISERITKVRGAIKINLDYYNARNANWEPIIEKFHIGGEIEHQLGSADYRSLRSGSLSVLVNDREFTNDPVVAVPFICINISDSAADLLLSALYEWKLWRKTVLLRQNATALLTSANSSPEAFDLSQGPYNIAAQNAANAALILAERRGIQYNKDGEDTSFILRNRTGMTVKFASEPHRNDAFADTFDPYIILSRDSDSITSVLDGDEARFSLDTIDAAEFHAGGENKIRSYEGQYPLLCLAFIAPPEVISIEVLEHMSVVKIGESQHKIYFQRNLDQKKDQRSFITAVWSVTLEKNRRIITISSSVKISSPRCSVPIEVGVKVQDKEDPTRRDIISLGISNCFTDYFLPLWLEFDNDSSDIFIKPTTENYDWSDGSIVSLLRFQSSKIRSNQIKWGTNNDINQVICKRDNLPSMNLSFYVSFRHSELRQSPSLSAGECSHIMCIEVSLNLTVRNSLPTRIEYEVADLRAKEENKEELKGASESKSLIQTSTLDSGGCVDVLNCDISSMKVTIRFRCEKFHDWSEWLPINYLAPSTNNVVQTFINEVADEKSHQAFASYLSDRNVTLHSRTDFGSPLTIGVKIRARKSTADDSNILGFDIIVYSELWLKNLTDLPIIFGAPSREIFNPLHVTNETHTYCDPNNMIAYSALMEIGDILDFEFNERAKGFENTGEDLDVLPLAYQQSEIVVEEVFEYVEMENGKIKNRWWAGEHHNSKRPDPAEIQPAQDSSWKWHSPEWCIDTTGECSIANDGWESCTNLVGAISRRFSPLRTFNADHRYRRRRWFRSKVRNQEMKVSDDSVFPFFQPMYDKLARERRASKEKDRLFRVGEVAEPRHVFLESFEGFDEESIKMCLRYEDGIWSSAANIPSSGSAHGIMRLYAARWPTLSRSLSASKANTDRATGYWAKKESKVSFSPGCTSRKCFDISYQVSSIDGPWGEHSRLIVIFPRFYIRNDSEDWHIELKQFFSEDDTAITLHPGYSSPFYWTDVSLPELVTIRPIHKGYLNQKNMYKWSGPLSISVLGAFPLRIRKNGRSKSSTHSDIPDIGVIRAQIELRSGTGGTGICVSFTAELARGSDSLYRLENHSPFPVWIAQDGYYLHMIQDKEVHGKDIYVDLIKPGESVAFGLDAPYLQLKGREVASLEELLKVRMSLAPPHTRDGKETMKVISLASIGNSVRLKPSKLYSVYEDDTILDLLCTNIQCEISNDGPCRVLQFRLVHRGVSASTAIKNTVRLHGSGPHEGEMLDPQLSISLNKIAEEVVRLLKHGGVPRYDPKRSNKLAQYTGIFNPLTLACDFNFHFQLSISGLLLSLVDKAPSEVAVLSMKKIEAMGAWNKLRSRDASLNLSIGWIQFDNHCPNAPFPVALCPSIRNQDDDDDTENPMDQSFMKLSAIIAPKHKSNIMCLKAITFSSCDICIGADISFILRLQHFFLSIFEHYDRCRTEKNDALLSINTNFDFSVESAFQWHLPSFEKIYRLRTSFTGTKKGERQFYFESLIMHPFTVKFSVAPSVALTTAQAAMEGPEASAIHAAVRKGDLFIDEKAAGVLGVKIGSKNRTAIAVIRGIFKSILVDSFLQCNDASLNFSGLAVTNHISTFPQLRVFMGHHYLSALKTNVPALLGSLAAFGNPVGLIRGFGDGVTDFVSEPVKGLKKSVQQLDPSYVMDGVAKGTGSLARHTVGGIVDSASLLTETFSKNMAVLTLDRKYAQRRDRFKTLPGSTVNFVGGIESGFAKLVRGVTEGVVGVVKKPMRGAEKRGVEGFAKGVGKGLLGLIVKPVIGLSDAATDVMVGVKGSLDEVASGTHRATNVPIRPRRAIYGNDRRIRPYISSDAVSSAIMMKTRLAGENYLSHLDLGGRVVIISVRRLLLLDDEGETEFILKLKSIKTVEILPIAQECDTEWGVVISLKGPDKAGNDSEMVIVDDMDLAKELCGKIKQAIQLSF